MSDHQTTTPLDVLLAQERKYLSTDYLSCDGSTATSIDVDPDCRLKMAEWCDQCVDFCKFDREVVEITLNYLDRFASRDSFIVSDRSVFQLAAMTALYTAIKIHQNESVSSKSVSSLSRGKYTIQDIETMEVRMLNALEWKMSPITTSAMVRAILKNIPNLNKEQKASLYTLAKFQTDAASRDYAFVTMLPSTIAHCAILNAVETLADPSIHEGCLSFGRTVLGLNDTSSIQKYLYASIATTTAPSSPRRRPATPAQGGSAKQRRIGEQTESPRSSVILQCQ